MKNIILLLCVILLFNCSEGTDIKEYELVPSSSINKLKDFTYLSKTISEVKYYRGNIYFSDSFNSRIVVLDSNFVLKKIFGRPGNGPGDLDFAFNFDFYKDSIYVVDNSFQINVFTIDGKFVRRFFLENYPKIQFKFAISELGDIYINWRLGDKPIQVYNLSGKLINQFGRWLHDEHDYLKLTTNTRILFIDNSKLYSVLMSEPLVEIFDLKGNLLEEINLSEHPLLKKRLKTINQNLESRRNNPPKGILTWDVLFKNVYIYENSLFILYSIPYKEWAISNSVITINLLDSIKTVKNNLILLSEDHSNFTDICVTFNMIFGFNSVNNSLIKYYLNGVFFNAKNE
jgi:hypothetical protein